jgi:hypothetical protein
LLIEANDFQADLLVREALEKQKLAVEEIQNAITI